MTDTYRSPPPKHQLHSTLSLPYHPSLSRPATHHGNTILARPVRTSGATSRVAPLPRWPKHTHAYTQDAPRIPRSADQSHNHLRLELTRSPRRLEVPPALMCHTVPPALRPEPQVPHRAHPNLPRHAPLLLTAAAPSRLSPHPLMPHSESQAPNASMSAHRTRHAADNPTRLRLRRLPPAASANSSSAFCSSASATAAAFSALTFFRTAASDSIGATGIAPASLLERLPPTAAGGSSAEARLGRISPPPRRSFVKRLRATHSAGQGTPVLG